MLELAKVLDVSLIEIVNREKIDKSELEIQERRAEAIVHYQEIQHRRKNRDAVLWIIIGIIFLILSLNNEFGNYLPKKALELMNGFATGFSIAALIMGIYNITHKTTFCCMKRKFIKKLRSK